MGRRPLVQFVATIVVTVFAAGIWLTEGRFNPEWLRFFSLAVWLAVVALMAWDKLFWRFAWIQKLTSVPRNLRGTWRGTLKSSWINPETGETREEKEVFLVIRQDASRISTVLLTDESLSYSTVAVLTDDDPVVSLDYMYLNRPDSGVEDRSRMHHGSTSLDVIGRPAKRLRGRYWTDRDTRGHLEFVERKSEIVEGYKEARELFQSDNDISK